MENAPDEFHTPSGYKAQNQEKLTESMEDYLEMICRFSQSRGYVRVHELAERLHVSPSSASKMAANLKEAGLVDFKKYGLIQPSPSGKKIGAYLLYRHRVIMDFVQLLNTGRDLRQVEQIEHYLEETTVRHLEILTQIFNENPSLLSLYQKRSGQADSR